MKQTSGKELTRVLEKNGWSLLRINGRHHYLWSRRQHRAPLSASSRKNRPLKIGLLSNLLKQAGLTEADL